MSTLALVSCGKTKLQVPSKAEDLYVGDLFKKTRAYAEKNHDEWCILSALHHLVLPDQILEPYEYTLIGKKKDVIEAWSLKVHAEIKHKYSTETEIYFYAGREYRKTLVPLLEADGYQIFTPLQGLGIGEQLSWFKQKQIG